jgi:hypothetical protein
MYSVTIGQKATYEDLKRFKQVFLFFVFCRGGWGGILAILTLPPVNYVSFTYIYTGSLTCDRKHFNFFSCDPHFICKSVPVK